MTLNTQAPSPKQLSAFQDLVSFPSSLVKKFLPLGMMFFFMALIYIILRDTKDTLIFSIPGSGVELFTFLKFKINLPLTILFALFYVFLCHILSRDKLFYSVLIPFLVYFAAFALFIYPNHNALHMTEEAVLAMQTENPALMGLGPVLQNWSYALFYLLAELWGPAMMTVFFWQFANDIMTVKEAKKAYVLLGIFSTVGFILGGYIVVSHLSYPSPEQAFAEHLQYLMGIVTISGITIMALYYWITQKILTDTTVCLPASTHPTDNTSVSSFMDSLVPIFKSPYLWLIIGIIFSQGLLSYMLEMIWKKNMGFYFSGSKGEYNQMMGDLSAATGYLGMILLFVGYFILAYFRWLTVALITPILTLVMGLIFLGLVAYSNGLDPSMPFMGTTLSKGVIWIGYFSMKIPQSLGLFAATLIIAYIPLNQNLKTKGRAIIELFFVRIIKSITVFMVSSLFIYGEFNGKVPNYTSLIPITAVLLIAIVIIWILCVKALSNRFEALTKETGQE